MKRFWKVFFYGIFFVLPNWIQGQDDTTATRIVLNGGMDLVSRYVWRGRDYENSPAVQPWMEANIRNITLGAWGSYKLVGAGIQETDLYVKKSFGNFSVSVWDYYNFTDTLAGNYFDYREATTGHLFELQAAWTSAWEKNTLSLLMGWFFAGYDKDRSYYIEAQWTKELSDNNSAGLVLGFTPKAGYYASRAAVVNAGVFYTRNIKFNQETSVPLSLSLVLNPEEKHLYLVAVLSL